MPALYKVSRNDNIGWDEYDAFVVSAETEDQAKTFSPCGGVYQPTRFDCWSAKDLTVTLVGTTDLPIGEVVLASFNAG